MLLFGFVLLSTVLAAVQGNTRNAPIIVRLHNGTIEWLGPQNDDIIATNEHRQFEIKLSRSNELQVNALSIKDFKKDWYRLQNDMVHSINLDENLISEITRHTLNQLPANITSASLKRNNIERLREGVINNEYLVSLDLTLNDINTIEARALKMLPKLTSLNLQGNHLTDVKFASTLPVTMQELWLNGNSIKAIPAGSFSRLTQLQKLYLHENKIITLKRRSFKGLGKLTLLQLGGNRLEKVNVNTFKSTPLLNVVVYDNMTQNFIAGDDILARNSSVLTLRSSV